MSVPSVKSKPPEPAYPRHQRHAIEGTFWKISALFSNSFKFRNEKSFFAVYFKSFLELCGVRTGGKPGTILATDKEDVTAGKVKKAMRHVIVDLAVRGNIHLNPERFKEIQKSVGKAPTQ